MMWINSKQSITLGFVVAIVLDCLGLWLRLGFGCFNVVRVHLVVGWSIGRV